MSKNSDRESYMKQFPETRKWLNECLICGTVGYKPELPEEIFPGLMAYYFRKFYTPLEVNELSICIDCAKHWEKKNKNVC